MENWSGEGMFFTGRPREKNTTTILENKHNCGELQLMCFTPSSGNSCKSQLHLDRLYFAMNLTGTTQRLSCSLDVGLVAPPSP